MGYQVIKYFKLTENGHSSKVGKTTKEQMQMGVTELKLLVSSVYQYYGAQEDVNSLLTNMNPFLECFLDQIVDHDYEQGIAKFLKYMKDNRFMQAYEKLTRVCFNIKYDDNAKDEKRILIDTQVKKFV